MALFILSGCSYLNAIMGLQDHVAISNVYTFIYIHVTILLVYTFIIVYNNTCMYFVCIESGKICG